MNIAEYIKKDKTITDAKRENFKPLKVALLSSFTTKGLKETINVKCHDLKIKSDFYVADYNQYAQEILEPGSDLYKFQPDIVFVFIDVKSLLGETYFSFYDLADEQKTNLLAEKQAFLKQLISALQQNTQAKIIWHNFEVPSNSPLGILENKQNIGWHKSIQGLNTQLAQGHKDNQQIYIFDYNNFCSKIGKNQITDSKMYYLADIKLALEYFPLLADSYLGYIKPLCSLNKKCLVLDLDNTLWGGIIGEDSLAGIHLGPTPEGRSFWELQKYILSLHKRGVILAINSKNNPAEVKQVFTEHPHMILKEEHFASMQINWQDKISNMKAISQELSIGLEAIVFMDDDKLNQTMIKQALPEIKVLDLPDDPAKYLDTLMNIDDFNVLQLTEEDKQKGQMYAAQRQRTKLQTTTQDLSQYLKQLEMEATLAAPDSVNIARLAQLTQKTNQFNMTTKRYSEEDIKNFASQDGYLIQALSLKDKFGDNGTVGLAIVKKNSTNWKIENFLLSCRVIGRDAEKILLGSIINLAKEAKVKSLLGEFIQTEKNTPAENFYKDNKFTPNQKDDSSQLWEFNLAQEYELPNYIKIK